MAYRRRRAILVTRSAHVAGFLNRPISNPTGARRQPKAPRGADGKKG
jgi:hypothetical protein